MSLRLSIRPSIPAARDAAPQGEISGHFHPKATVPSGGKRIRGRCFVTDGRRLILPSFGAYTGGLDVTDPAISQLLSGNFTVHLLGRARVHTLRRHQLEPANGPDVPDGSSA